MDSEFVLDSVLSSCQVAQGSGGCKFNIFEKKRNTLVSMDSQMMLTYFKMMPTGVRRSKNYPVIDVQFFLLELQVRSQRRLCARVIEAELEQLQAR